MNTPTGNPIDPLKDPDAYAEEYFSAATELQKGKVGRKTKNITGLILIAGIGLCGWGMYEAGGLTRFLWLLGMVLLLGGLQGVLFFLREDAICPRCKNNFTRCAPEFCHCCGKKLEKSACEGCGVNWAWTAMFESSSEMTGNEQPVRFCPSCGVFLGSDLRRDKDYR